MSAYHKEVRLWVHGGAVQGEDAGTSEVLGQRDSQVGVVEGARILYLSCACNAGNASLDGEVCLAQSASLDEDLSWAGLLATRLRCARSRDVLDVESVGSRSGLFRSGSARLETIFAVDEW